MESIGIRLGISFFLYQDVTATVTTYCPSGGKTPGKVGTMKITLLGATGNIGSRILREALDRGHEVTAIVRNPDKLTVKHENLHVLKGDALEPETLRNPLKSAEAVISALSPAFTDQEPFLAANRNLMALVREEKTPRLVVVGGASSLYVEPGVRLFDTGVMPKEWTPYLNAHFDLLATLKESGLPWTYFSPAATIEAGERTGKYRKGGTDLIKDAEGNSRITYEDYAVALLDELEKPERIGVQFTAAY